MKNRDPTAEATEERNWNNMRTDVIAPRTKYTDDTGFFRSCNTIITIRDPGF